MPTNRDVTRVSWRWACVLGFFVVAIAGCGETQGSGGGGTAGTGGDGGSGGVGGIGGTGNMPECQSLEDCDDSNACTDDLCNWTCSNIPVDCSDRNDCTTEGPCEPVDGCPAPTPAADGTPCAGGTCQSGACELATSTLPCTEQGIRNAIAAGGGPYTFDCDGPQTVVTEAGIEIDNDVILDGEGNLTVHGNGPFALQSNTETTTDLRGFIVTGGSTYGIAAVQGAMTLTDSAVSDSRGTGLFALGSTVTIANSAVSGNASCGIENRGGALTIVNSTVSGNASCGIGLYTRGAGFGETSNATLSLISSTVSLPGGAGRAIFVEPGVNPSEENVATIANSLVHGACSGHIISDGNNVERPGDTCRFDQPTDQANVSADDLKLGPLADNGGPTRTHALLPGSVAIDRIPDAECVDADGEPLTEDQRGVARPQGGSCDVGAFELEVTP